MIGMPNGQARKVGTAAIHFVVASREGHNHTMENCAFHVYTKCIPNGQLLTLIQTELSYGPRVSVDIYLHSIRREVLFSIIIATMP